MFCCNQIPTYQLYKNLERLMPTTDIIEERTNSFNLSDKPWILVTTEKGSTKRLSLREVFSQAENIICLSNENVYVDTSITLLLFAILYTAYSRNADTKDMDQDEFTYRKDVILDYLDSVHDRFDLYDAQYPFMQIREDFKVENAPCTKEIKEGSKHVGYEKVSKSNSLRDKGKKIKCLNPFSSSAHKSSQWSLKEDYTDDWVARHLVTYRLFHLSASAASGNSITIKAGVLTKNISLMFITGETLADLFHLNFKEKNLGKEMHPIWEQDQEAEDAYINSKVFFDKKEGVYYDAYSDHADIARILTYSNVYINIDPHKKEKVFKQCYRLPIKLFSIRPNSDGKDPSRYDWSYLSERLNIFCSNLDRNTYSIQKEILWDSDNDSLIKAKYISLVRTPKLNDQNSTYTQLFTKPINLIGNGLLKVDAQDDDHKEDIRNLFTNLCGKLEESENKFKKRCDNALKQLFNKDDPKKNKGNKKKEMFSKIYASIHVSDSSYAETQFFDFITSIAEKLSDANLLEKEENALSKRVYAHYLTSYKNFIKDYCPKLYFLLIDKLTLGVNTMSKLETIKAISTNTYACMKANFKDLVQLRSMRQCKYVPDLNLEGFRLFSNGGRRDHYMKEGIKYALYLWSNHQHKMGDGYAGVIIKEDFIKETTSYKNTFGYVMYKLRPFYTEDEWKSKLHKYELASHNIDMLAKFILLTTKEALDHNIDVQLDYGRLAYFFTRILENTGNTHEFLEDVMVGFYLAKEAVIPRTGECSKESETH